MPGHSREQPGTWQGFLRATAYGGNYWETCFPYIFHEVLRLESPRMGSHCWHTRPENLQYFSCLIKEVDCFMNTRVNSGVFSVSFPNPHFNYAFSLRCNPDFRSITRPWATKVGWVQRDSHSLTLYIYLQPTMLPYPPYTAEQGDRQTNTHRDRQTETKRQRETSKHTHTGGVR